MRANKVASLIPVLWFGSLPIRRGRLEMFAQFREATYNEQFLWRRNCIHFVMFENPRISMRHENRVQSRGQRRIDVRLGAIADHPRGAGRQRIFLDDGLINDNILFCDDFGSREILLQFGALNLSSLLRDCTLGYKD